MKWKEALICDEGGVCRIGYHHGRSEGYPGRVDWGAREQQILAVCVERPQKQGSFGCISVLHGRSVRHDAGYSGHVSPEPVTALHRPSDSFLHPLCQLEGYQAGGGRSEENLHRRYPG